jgi:DNA replication and repair protein RecF
MTQVGPHRSDLRITLAGTSARSHVSRGEQKLLTTALLLAQARVLIDRRGIAPVLLVDDIAAELGPGFRSVLGNELVALGTQVFISFLDRAHVPEALVGGRCIQVKMTDFGSTAAGKRW